MSERIGSLSDFLLLLKGVKKVSGGYMALCPGHDDHEQSLSVKESDGKILVHCHAGCSLNNVLKPLGLSGADLFLNESGPPPKANRRGRSKPEHREVEAIYDYIDANGKPFQVVRTTPKGFFQRRSDGKDGYINDLKGIVPTLYHQDDIEVAITFADPIIIVEGEKDADNLKKLNFWSIANPMGAGKWQDRYSEALKGADVVIIPDNDDQGHKHAAEVAQSLCGKAIRIRTLELPDAKDISAWLDLGHTGKELWQLIDSCPDYQPVSKKYLGFNKKGELELKFEELAKDILSENRFITLDDTDDILVYREGYYQRGGEAWTKEICQQKVGITRLLSRHRIDEVLGHIQRSTYVSRSEINRDKYVLNLKNGLLDIHTRELRPHTPDHKSTIRIPVEYNTNAACPKIRRFLREVLEPKDITLIHELFGYCLYPDYQIQRAFLCLGDGSNGKSKLLGLLRAFLGEANTSNVSWQRLEMDKFALADLYAKLANVFADLPSQPVRFLTMIKMLTGGDEIRAEEKFKKPFNFKNHAKLVFSANHPPEVPNEDSYAFWRRWVLINFPNTFPEGDSKTDLDILDKLVTSEELSGLLTLALDGLDRLLKNQRLSYDKTVPETTDIYLKASDPVYAFLSDHFEADPNYAVPKEEVMYPAFMDYCKHHGIPPLKPNAFGRRVKNQIQIRVTTSRPDFNSLPESIQKFLTKLETAKKTPRPWCWQGLKPVQVGQDVYVPTFLKALLRENNEKGTEEPPKDLKKGMNIDNSDNPDNDLEEASNDIPDYPTMPCQCGSTDYWLTPWKQWFCSRCHPKPEEETGICIKAGGLCTLRTGNKTFSCKYQPEECPFFKPA